MKFNPGEAVKPESYRISKEADDAARSQLDYGVFIFSKARLKPVPVERLWVLLTDMQLNNQS